MLPEERRETGLYGCEHDGGRLRSSRIALQEQWNFLIKQLAPEDDMLLEGQLQMCIVPNTCCALLSSVFKFES
jgi:hypothetical protein